MIRFYDSLGYFVDIEMWVVILISAIVLAVFVAFYLLRSFGVYKLAKAQGLNTAFMAFIPGLWTYPACKLAGESRFFRTSIGKVALVFTILVTASVVINLAYNLFIYVPIVGYAIQGGENASIVIGPESVPGAGYNGYVLSGIWMYGFSNPYNDVVLFRLVYILNRVTNILSAFSELALIFIYFAIFRKFWPERYWMAAILSAFGLFSPLVFAIRNRKAVNYEEFIRSRMSMYGSPYNPYGQNPYGRNESQRQEENDKEDGPFSDFEEEKKPPEDPFSEFDEDK